MKKRGNGLASFYNPFQNSPTKFNRFLHRIKPLAQSVDPLFVDASVETGGDYYYKVTATDFSGNETDPSAEVNLAITAVSGSNEIPTEYTLLPLQPGDCDLLQPAENRAVFLKLNQEVIEQAKLYAKQKNGRLYGAFSYCQCLLHPAKIKIKSILLSEAPKNGFYYYTQY